MAHDHYFKDVSHLDKIDVYRVLDLFGVAHPALAHAAKKILVAGNRGAKDIDKDVQEAIDALQRWQEMRREDNKKLHPLGDGGETVSMLDKLGIKVEINDSMPENTLALGYGLIGEPFIPKTDSQIKQKSYADESGYTEQDLQAASLVHDATPLDPELVELCSKTEIHADADGWIPHVGDKCPVEDETQEVMVKYIHGAVSLYPRQAKEWKWDNLLNKTSTPISHWRYAVLRKD